MSQHSRWRVAATLAWALMAPGAIAEERLAAPEAIARESTAVAAEAPAEPAAESAEPAPVGLAMEIVREAAAHLESLDGFRMDATTVYDVVQASGQKLQFSNRRIMSLRRPDRAHVSYTDDHGGSHHVYYDGDTLTRYDRRANVYGEIDVPDSLDELFDYLEIELGSPLPLADLFYSDLSHLGSQADESVLVGAAFVTGVMCDHLAFRNEEIDWQVWVEQGDEPWVRKVVITYRTVEGAPQFSAFFTAWSAEPELDDSLFEFTPPWRAERISTVALPPRGGTGEVELKGEPE